MNRLAADMAMMNTMTEPMRKALSDAMDQPSRIAGSMDSSFRNIQISLGATNAEMETTRRELLAIGGRAAAGPQAVASAFSDVASGVADASKHMAVMNAAVLLAEANQSDLASATGAMVNVMNAWNLSADNAGLAADILTQTALMGVGSMDEFASSIGNISALAANAGIGLDELGASFAYATNKGMNAGQVQKQLKGIITTLASPSESLASLYESLGIESGQAMLSQYGLADSLAILRDAMGDDAAFADMIGSLDAANVALALTEDAYVDFATSFGEGMAGVSEAARGVQLESIEMKMARLDAASASLQAQIGQDINGIKGFFVDMKFGFISNVVSPIMTSPLGGALSKVAAGTGMLAKGILDVGSGAMTAATQMTTLAANVSNAGGIAKMFKHGMGLAGASVKMLGTPLRVAGSGLAGMGRSIITALPTIGGYIASMWASAAATLAATWPILAIIAGVAALAAGVYFLIKHWDSVAGFFAGLWEKIKGFFSAAWDWIKGIIFGASDWVLAAIAIFMPIVGIPALIIKHWDKIKAFFAGLWEGAKAAASAFTGWFPGAMSAVGNFFKGIWDGIKNFFAAIWNGIKFIVVGYVKWYFGIWAAVGKFFVKVWEGIASFFSGVWDWMKGNVAAFTGWFRSAVSAVGNFFSGIWEGIAGFFAGVWDWMKGNVAAFTEWFRSAVSAVGDFFKGIFESVGNFFGGVWDGAMNFFAGAWEKAKSIVSGFADWLGGIVGAITAPFKAIGEAVGGVFEKAGGFFKGFAGGAKDSGAALNDAFAEGIRGNAAAPGTAFTTSLQGIGNQMPHSDAPEGPLSTLTASGRALTETFAGGMDAGDLREKATLVFGAAAPDSEAAEFPPTATRTQAGGTGPTTVHIENLYLQAEDCQNALDFVRKLMQIASKPQGAAV